VDGERYYCPCCGYHGLQEPAYGFEFGYDDDPGASGRACSFGQYRAERVSQQMVWFRSDRRPGGWSLAQQLRAAGIPQDAGQDAASDPAS